MAFLLASPPSLPKLCCTSDALSHTSLPNLHFEYPYCSNSSQTLQPERKIPNAWFYEKEPEESQAAGHRSFFKLDFAGSEKIFRGMELSKSIVSRVLLHV